MCRDQEVPIKFIFTVGSTLTALLGAHQSAYRQLASVELGRLGWKGRREIAMKAAHAFSLDLDDNIAWRIAMVTYTEKILRSYVRMQAEANSVELTGERAAPRQHIHVPTNARSGYRGSSVPRGVRLRSESQSLDVDDVK